MKHMHTPSHTFIAVRFDTTGRVLLKPLEVVKKFSIVVTPCGREEEEENVQMTRKLIKNWKRKRRERAREGKFSFCESRLSGMREHRGNDRNNKLKEIETDFFHYALLMSDCG
jgi:hypothetical protein